MPKAHQWPGGECRSFGASGESARFNPWCSRIKPGRTARARWPTSSPLGRRWRQGAPRRPLGRTSPISPTNIAEAIARGKLPRPGTKPCASRPLGPRRLSRSAAPRSAPANWRSCPRTADQQSCRQGRLRQPSQAKGRIAPRCFAAPAPRLKIEWPWRARVLFAKAQTGRLPTAWLEKASEGETQPRLIRMWAEQNAPAAGGRFPRGCWPTMVRSQVRKGHRWQLGERSLADHCGNQSDHYRERRNR